MVAGGRRSGGIQGGKEAGGQEKFTGAGGRRLGEIREAGGRRSGEIQGGREAGGQEILIYRSPLWLRLLLRGHQGGSDASGRIARTSR